VVLMDCQMPEMDGFEAATAGSSMAECSVIVCLLNPMQDRERQRNGDREVCLNGMNDYLAKPIRSVRCTIPQKWIVGEM